MRTMKLKSLIVCIVVSGIVGLTSSPAEAATILYQSANTVIYLGEPYTSLEFENPLAGTEMIKEYGVKEWMDADYSAGRPRWYDDWNVNDSAGIDGYANEIWLRWGGIRSGHHRQYPVPLFPFISMATTTMVSLMSL